LPSKTSVHIRSPWPPHARLAQVAVKDLSYSFMLMESGTASFELPTSDPNLADYAHLFQVGMMISIERNDGLMPWVGWLSAEDGVSGGGAAAFDAEDHIGVLFEKARNAKSQTENLLGAAEHIRRAVASANRQGHPPLLIGLDLNEGGPLIAYTPQAEYLDDLLRRMSEASGWEWGLRFEVTEGRALTTLEWRKRRGLDLSAAVIWEEGKHFEQARYRRKASAFISSTLAVGGTGNFRTRQAVTNVRAAADDDAIGLRPAPEPVTDEQPFPSLQGTRVMIFPNVSNDDALAASAQREQDSPEHVREQVSFSLVEDAINLTSPPAPGDVVTVRFSDILTGAAVTRQVRLLGLQLNPEKGTIDVECKVERKEVAGAKA